MLEKLKESKKALVLIAKEREVQKTHFESEKHLRTATTYGGSSHLAV